jgi:hypothetical protein
MHSNQIFSTENSDRIGLQESPKKLHFNSKKRLQTDSEEVLPQSNISKQGRLVKKPLRLGFDENDGKRTPIISPILLDNPPILFDNAIKSICRKVGSKDSLKDNPKNGLKDSRNDSRKNSPKKARKSVKSPSPSPSSVDSPQDTQEHSPAESPIQSTIKPLKTPVQSPIKQTVKTPIYEPPESPQVEKKYIQPTTNPLQPMTKDQLKRPRKLKPLLSGKLKEDRKPLPKPKIQVATTIRKDIEAELFDVPEIESERESHTPVMNLTSFTAIAARTAKPLSTDMGRRGRGSKAVVLPKGEISAGTAPRLGLKLATKGKGLHSYLNK